MAEKIDFIYGKEFWYVSVFYNSSKVPISKKIMEIEELIKQKVNNLTDDDLGKIKWNKEWIKAVKELGKNMSFSINFENILDYFPFHDENTNITYDRLGTIRFNVEYYKDNPEKKEKIKPIFIQQIPIVILNELNNYNNQKANEYITFDTESPIYVFLFSYKMKPNIVKWTPENIKKYKKIIGNWNEVYQGAWPDYSEELYSNRIKGNLSNRISELHYIKRNSGFIYMEEENFKLFFPYMEEFVMKPTARIRAIKYALMNINSSLDILFLRQNFGQFSSIDQIEEKMKSLKQLRGMIQTELGHFFDELDYNRRQHYTSVLKHLINIFNFIPGGILDRMKDKFDTIYDSISFLYQKRQEENAKKTEKSINLLNYLFGLGILADFTGLIIGSLENLPNIKTISVILNAIASILIIVFFVYFLYTKISEKMSMKKELKPIYTVDGVILDKEHKKIVLVIRKYPPFKDNYALPGGFIEEKETPEQALLREIKEETNLNVKIISKIGIYDDPNRDPRGNIISHAFLCEAENISKFKAMDDAKEVVIMPLDKINGLDLAFDHEDILKDALNLLK
ncbi:MAG: NUDIX domain-containing protein [Promethearchaeota archaeon]